MSDEIDALFAEFDLVQVELVPDGEWREDVHPLTHYLVRLRDGVRGSLIGIYFLGPSWLVEYQIHRKSWSEFGVVSKMKNASGLPALREYLTRIVASQAWAEMLRRASLDRVTIEGPVGTEDLVPQAALEIEAVLERYGLRARNVFEVEKT